MRFEGKTSSAPRKKKFQFSNFGFSTILLTFVMMCIMTFSVLSLITANSDLKLSNKVVEKAGGYATAKEMAYQDMTKLDAFLTAYFEGGGQLSDVAGALTEAGFTPDSTDNTEAVPTLSYTYSVTDTQQLSVILCVTDQPNSEYGYFTITQWETTAASTGNEIIDDTLHLMGTDE